LPVTATRSVPVPPARRRRGLRALVAATGISSLGDGAFIAAAPLAAAAITRDPLAVATVTAAEYLPWVLVAPFAGYYVDRWRKRTTMIVADLARAVLVGVLALMVASDSASVLIIAGCAFGIVMGTVFHSAAAEAVIADLGNRDDVLLHTVNGRQQAAYAGGRQLVGPPVGSLTFSVARWLPFAVDAISFLTSAVLLILVPPGPAARPGPRGLWRALRGSAAFLLAHRDLRVLALLTGISNFTVNMVMSILVLFATDPDGLGITEAGYGLLLVAMAVGGIGGGFMAARAIRRFGARSTMIVGLTAQGVAWLVIATVRDALVAGASLAVAFAGVTLVSVVVVTTRQQQAPPEMLGQVISAFRIVGNGPAPLGALAGGALAGLAGLPVPIFVAAALTITAVPLVLQLHAGDRG
jgi:MFS family permease